MRRQKNTTGAPGSATGPSPGAPWLIGAMIGMTIMTMASGAMALGAGLALSRTGTKPG